MFSDGFDDSEDDSWPLNEELTDKNSRHSILNYVKTKWKLNNDWKWNLERYTKNLFQDK